MDIKLITENDRQEWNDFVASSPNSPILQSYEWAEFKSCFGWEPLRLAVTEHGKIIAGASILKREIPFIKKTIFYSPRGPVVDFKNEEALSFLVLAIKEQAKKHKAIVLKADPNISEKDVGSVVSINRQGFNFVKKQIQPRATFLINLEKTEEEIMDSFEDKTRYNIKIAAKHKVTIEQMPTTEGIDIFYKIYLETASRNKFLIHPKDYYLKLERYLINRGMAGVFTAFYNNEPVAAVFIFSFGKKIWYMYGASKAQYRKVMPNHALHWEVIKWAKEAGYKTYDLWGIPAHPHENHPLWGVYRFKKGFGGEPVKWVGACDLALQPFYYHLFETGVKSWQAARSFIAKGKIEDSLSE